MGQIHNIEKLTDCKFLNLYHLNATSVHNTPVSYFVATRCFEAGIPPKTVQSYLGHTNIQMTMDIYTEVLSDKKMSDIKLLESTMNDINTCRAFQKIS